MKYHSCHEDEIGVRLFRINTAIIIPHKSLSWLRKELRPQSIIFCNKLCRISLGFIHNSSQLAQFELTRAPQDRWKDKVYHTESAISLEQCAAHCNLIVTGSYSCNLLSWDGNICYIGNHEKTASSNIAVPGDISQIYIHPCTKTA